MTWSLHTGRFAHLETLRVEDVRARACDYAWLCFTPKAR
jgi:hypothetical protein